METIYLLLQSKLGEIIAVAVAGFALILVKTIIYTYKYFKNNNRVNKRCGFHEPSTIPDRVNTDLGVYNEISRLLFISNAARCSIKLFHNGSVFSTNNPIWRFSKTYEVCQNGVKPELESSQNIMIAHMTQMLNPIFNSDVEIKGIEKISSTIKGANMLNNFNIFRMKQDEISHFYISSYMMNRAIKDLVYCPIFDSQSNVIGLLCLDYCLDDEYNKTFSENGQEIIKELYETSLRLSEKI